MIKIRAEKLNSKVKVEGWYVESLAPFGLRVYLLDTDSGLSLDTTRSGNLCMSMSDSRCHEIKNKTLEVYLFGEWRLVSELETKYKLIEQ